MPSFQDSILARVRAGTSTVDDAEALQRMLESARGAHCGLCQQVQMLSDLTQASAAGVSDAGARSHADHELS